MFPVQGLFAKVSCPDFPKCSLNPCLFSHRPPAPVVRSSVASSAPTSSSTSTAAASTSRQPAISKRSVSATSLGAQEPPRKAVKTEAAAAPPPARPAPSTKPAQSVLAQRLSVAPVASSSSASLSTQVPAPRIDSTKGFTHTPTVDRQKMLTTLFAQFVDNYSALHDPLRARQLASEHAKAQEALVFGRTNKMTYKNGMISTLASLKKRPKPKNESETGTLEDDAKRAKERTEQEKGKLDPRRIKRYLASKEQLAQYDYVVQVPDGPGSTQPTEEGNKRTCQRCAREFVVKSELEEEELTACSYHFGRKITEKAHGVKRRVYSCCPAPEAPPCSVGPHVFQDKDAETLHARVAFKKVASLDSVSSGKSAGLPVVALDCELVYTTSGMSLARVTAVNDEGQVIFDEHVRPQGHVLDLNTRYSGVKPQDLEKAVFDLDGVREALGLIVSEGTILVGHALENDLSALRLVHDRVIDTAILFAHPNGPPWRYALRILSRDHLGKFIQDSDSSLGHSALEDSRAALELVRHKMKQDLYS